jgi:2-C-methyl-D-erythritol 4-phosphate cytidylyltransferase/2-C-methyl-D-erythritol 2,4-cyclodiphosphate synthase
MKAAALIMAAGRGTRLAGVGTGPKQYMVLAGLPVIARSLAPFLAHPGLAIVQPVIGADDAAPYGESTHRLSEASLAPAITGGATRQASVRAGLEALRAHQPDVVLIHDAARPFVARQTIDDVLAALARHPGAIAARPVTDTIKQGDAGGVVAATIARDRLWRAETPQGFWYAAILDAHERAASVGLDTFTDDAAIAEWAGMAVALVPVAAQNMKITTAEDLAMAQALLAAGTQCTETRTGTGFDVHRFTTGDHVWLGGVRIPHAHGLEGHSDADVALHALTDALLGAIGDGDIGQHFPPSDSTWKGAASHLFMADAARRITARGGQIVNVDLTLLCETPRIGPHRGAMRTRIAEILGLAIDRVGVKATTTEGLGFTGRREGIAAMAVASVRLPAR